MEDDCPYEPEGELGVPVCYVIVPDVDQFDLHVRGHQHHLGFRFQACVFILLKWRGHKVFFTHLSVFEEVQGDLYVLQLVEAHAAFLPWLRETRRQQTSGGEDT